MGGPLLIFERICLKPVSLQDDWSASQDLLFLQAPCPPFPPIRSIENWGGEQKIVAIMVTVPTLSSCPALEALIESCR